MMYHVDVYEDAHDETWSRRHTVETLKSAFSVATALATELATEDSGLRFGDAGDDELFESFPRLGNGTVVVTPAARKGDCQ